MASEKLKYNIEAIVRELPGAITIGKIEEILLNDHSISRDTFYRDRKVKIGESFSIPEDRMHIYSCLFECTVEELKNYVPKKIRPINDRKFSKVVSVATKKSNMVKGAVKLIALVVLTIALSSCNSYKGLGKCPSYNGTTMHRYR